MNLYLKGRQILLKLSLALWICQGVLGCATLKNTAFFKGNPRPPEHLPLPKMENQAPTMQQASPLPNPILPEKRAPLPGINLTPVEGNSWRTALPPALVFGMMARILSERYNVTNVDRKSLNIKTDWDNFFIAGRLMRNRISVSIIPISKRQTEVIIKNVVEYYNGSPTKTDLHAWLPSPDITDEVMKLVDFTNRQSSQIYQKHLAKTR